MNKLPGKSAVISWISRLCPPKTHSSKLLPPPPPPRSCLSFYPHPARKNDITQKNTKPMTTNAQQKQKIRQSSSSSYLWILFLPISSFDHIQSRAGSSSLLRFVLHHSDNWTWYRETCSSPSQKTIAPFAFSSPCQFLVFQMPEKQQHPPDTHHNLVSSRGAFKVNLYPSTFNTHCLLSHCRQRPVCFIHPLSSPHIRGFIHAKQSQINIQKPGCVTLTKLFKAACSWHALKSSFWRHILSFLHSLSVSSPIVLCSRLLVLVPKLLQ